MFLLVFFFSILFYRSKHFTFWSISLTHLSISQHPNCQLSSFCHVFQVSFNNHQLTGHLFTLPLRLFCNVLIFLSWIPTFSSRFRALFSVTFRILLTHFLLSPASTVARSSWAWIITFSISRILQFKKVPSDSAWTWVGFRFVLLIWGTQASPNHLPSAAEPGSCRSPASRRFPPRCFQNSGSYLLALGASPISLLKFFVLAWNLTSSDIFFTHGLWCLFACLNNI